MARPSFQSPFLKWVGGKTQIIDQVIERFPSKMRNYHEIFLGGGSVLLAMLTCVADGRIKVTGKIYAYDLNETLIHVYKNIQSKPEALFERLIYLSESMGNCPFDDDAATRADQRFEIHRNPETLDELASSQESYYYWVRKEYNGLSREARNDVIGSAMFIFLNKMCFRGLYRVGPNGFNVPYGHYKSLVLVGRDDLMAVSRLIQSVEFRCADFKTSIADSALKKTDFMYLDPPYVPIDAKSFVAYNKEGFGLNEHQELFRLCNETKGRFLLSNAEAKLVTDAFTDERFTIDLVSCRRAINSKNPGGRVNEVLIKN